MTKKILKQADIARMMTDKVYEYVVQGYTIDLNHNSGHQGEKAKVVLIKDNINVVVYVDRESVDLDDTGYRWDDATVLRVERQADVHPNNTLWLGKGKVVEEVVFYHVSNDYNVDAFTTDKEVAKEAKAKRIARYRRRGEDDKMIKVTEKILNVTKNHWGYKSLTVEDIDCIERKRNWNNYLLPEYTIHFKGNRKSITVKA